MPSSKLTASQEKVLKWLGHGWRSNPHGGGPVVINGEVRCSSKTIKALSKRGFVEKDDNECWFATEYGCHYISVNCL